MAEKKNKEESWAEFTARLGAQIQGTKSPFALLGTPMGADPERDAVEALKLAQEAQMKADAAEAFRDQMSKQSSGIEQLRESLYNYKQSKPGVDWTPLGSLVDMLNANSPGGAKSNFAAMLNQSSLRPQSAAQRSKQIQEMEEGIQRAEERLSNTNYNYLNTMSGSKQARLESQKLRQTERNKRELLKDFRDTEKFLSKITDSSDVQGFNTVVDGLNRGTVQSVGQVLSFVARLFGEKGALSDSDIKRQMFDTYQNKLAAAGTKLSFTETKDGKIKFFQDGKEVSEQDLKTLKLDPAILSEMKRSLAATMAGKREEIDLKLKSKLERFASNPLYSQVLPGVLPGFTSTRENIMKALTYEPFEKQGQSEAEIKAAKLKRYEELKAKQAASQNR